MSGAGAKVRGAARLDRVGDERLSQIPQRDKAKPIPRGQPLTIWAHSKLGHRFKWPSQRAEWALCGGLCNIDFVLVGKKVKAVALSGKYRRKIRIRKLGRRIE